MATINRIPRIPKKPRVEIFPDVFSGSFNGGTLWQNLCVEENLLQQILVSLDPFSLMQLENCGSMIIRHYILNANTWKKKLQRNYLSLSLIPEVRDRLDKLVEGIPEDAHLEHLQSKMKVVRLWHLEENWNYGQSKTVKNGPLFSIEDPLSYELDTLFVNQKYILIAAIEGKMFLYDSTIGTSLWQSESRSYLSIANYITEDKIMLGFKITGSGRGEISMIDLNREHRGPQLIHINSNILNENIIENGDVKFISEQMLGLISENSDKLEVWAFNILQLDEPPLKVWTCDISKQTSIPKITIVAFVFNFSLAFIAKSNLVIEIWDIKGDYLVSAVDHTEVTQDRICEISVGTKMLVTTNLSGQCFVWKIQDIVGTNFDISAVYELKCEISKIDNVFVSETNISHVSFKDDREKYIEGIRNVYKVSEDFFRFDKKNNKRIIEKSKIKLIPTNSKRKKNTTKSKNKVIKPSSVSEDENIECGLDDDYQYAEDDQLVYEDSNDYNYEDDDGPDQFNY